MTRLARFFSVLVLIAVLSGCYERIEVNELAIAEVLGVDLTEDGRMRIAVQFVVPGRLGGQLSATGGGSGGADAPAIFVVEAVGSTLSEALSFLQAKIPRRLFTSHLRVVVLGEEFARSGIAPLLETFNRERELRKETHIVVTKGSARDLLIKLPELEPIPASAIVGLLEQGIVPIRTVRELLITLVTEGIDPFLPYVGLTNRLQLEGETSGQQGIDTSTAEFEIMGIGVFQDGKLVGFVNRYEARGLAWILNEVKSGLTTTVTWPTSWGHTRPSDLSPDEHLIMHDEPPTPDGPGPGFGLREPNKISTRILRSITQVNPVIDGDTIKMEIRVRAEDDLISNQAGVDVTNPERVRQIQLLINHTVKERIEDMLRVGQGTFRADIFGFGAVIHRKHPKVWRDLKKDWHAHFASVEVDVVVETKIRRTGLTQNPGSYTTGQMRW